LLGLNWNLLSTARPSGRGLLLGFVFLGRRHLSELRFPPLCDPNSTSMITVLGRFLFPHFHIKDLVKFTDSSSYSFVD
jgi:hypothetical protein